MVRALLIATLMFISARPAAFGQELGTLHIKVAVVDNDRKPTPVPRHALLISDNPTTAPPRQVITALDGSATVRLRPGNYTVESDRSVVFQGRAYEWIQMVDIRSGGDAVLELTADNAEIGPPTAADAGASSLAADPSFLLPQWENSVVAVWTPGSRASGFLIDPRGLVATSQRVIGTATSVEVQLSPAIKVAARLLAADPERDVAILWIAPAVVASVRPVPLGCAPAAPPVVVDGQELFAIGASVREQKAMTSGTVSHVDPHAIVADFRLAPGSTGGPVFAADGSMVGITSIVDDTNDSRGADSRVVRLDDVCEVVATMENESKDVAPPEATHRPVDPVRPFPVAALKEAAQRRAGSLNPYQLSASDFDVAFVTPVLVYAAQYPPTPVRVGERGKSPRAPDPTPARVRPQIDFGRWSDYVVDVPPVLLIRVTPKLVEGFWTTVARGAARTQGVNLPAIKRVKSGFSRMRVLCGDVEVTPIHPFTLEQRVAENTFVEGLYAFEPGALGPHCGAVKLVLYSEKEPDTGDTRAVDPKVIEQIWQDFAPYRGL
jgi:S1-C subfamily serine protease